MTVIEMYELAKEIFNKNIQSKANNWEGYEYIEDYALRIKKELSEKIVNKAATTLIAKTKEISRHLELMSISKWNCLMVHQLGTWKVPMPTK